MIRVHFEIHESKQLAIMIYPVATSFFAGSWKICKTLSVEENTVSNCSWLHYKGVIIYLVSRICIVKYKASFTSVVQQLRSKINAHCSRKMSRLSFHDLNEIMWSIIPMQTNNQNHLQILKWPDIYLCN